MKAVALYIYNKEGGLWPNAARPAVLGNYTYRGQRMCVAPTLDATLVYPTCLDDQWTRTEYVVFNGERYTANQVSTSEKNNESAFYKHEITFVSERTVLEHTYFLDVVSDDTPDDYATRYRSNDTTVYFYGTIDELAARLTDSMIYSGLCTVTGEGDNKEYDGYHVIVDDDIYDKIECDEIQQITFDNMYLNEALGQIYEKWGVGYYFDGKTIHIGNAQTDEDIPVVAYGPEDGLLKVAKVNAGMDIVNRITGIGSSDNIPYYYPNDSPYGEPVYTTIGIDADKVQIDLGRVVTNFGNALQTFSLYKDSLINIGQILPREVTVFEVIAHNIAPKSLENYVSARVMHTFYIELRGESTINWGDIYNNLGCTFEFDAGNLHPITGNADKRIHCVRLAKVENYQMRRNVGDVRYWQYSRFDSFNKLLLDEKNRSTGFTEVLSKFMPEAANTTTCTVEKDGYYILSIGIEYYSSKFRGEISISAPETAVQEGTAGYMSVRWNDIRVNIISADDRIVRYDKSGFTLPDNLPNNAYGTTTYIYSCDSTSGLFYLDGSPAGDAVSITITDIIWIPPVQHLMPSIYRETLGTERFYNAENDTYKKEDSNEYYTFVNEFDQGFPHEYRHEESDIKPSIKDMRNDVGYTAADSYHTIKYDGEKQLLGELAGVDFDDDDNDLLGTGESRSNSPFNGTDEYQHSYFYVKLHRFSGHTASNIDIGFNLFEQALEGQEAYIEMTSGDCAGCKFQIGVIAKNKRGEANFYNPVLVDEDAGRPVAGSYRDKVTAQSSKWQPAQQDTSENSVWIAVKKDNTTYKTSVMPSQQHNIRPKAGDKFVITGIKMPKAYVLAAEERLRDACIKYMYENNVEKWNFSITFSRVWLHLHPEVAERINENSRLNLRYNGYEYELFVKNYTCKSDGKSLLDVRVELEEELSGNEGKFVNTVTRTVRRLVNANSQERVMANAGNANHAAEADHAAESDHAAEADNADMWDGEHLDDWLDQPVKQDSDVTFRNLIIQQIIQASGGKITELEVKNLTVTGLMEIFRLLIRQVNATAGDNVQTAAGSEIESVEVVEGGYKCYWKNDDGTRKTRNTWMVGDQALCHTDNLDAPGQYEGVTNKHYWRLVTEVGEDYVVLSADIHEDYDGDYNAHSGHIPAAKDTIVQFGYQPQADDFDVEGGEMKRNVGRMSIQWEGSDNDGPFRGMWAAVKDFTMPGKPHIIRDGHEIIDSRIVEFTNRIYSYHNSENWVLVHNGVALPQTVDMGDWLYYFNRDGVVNAKRFERYSYMGCLLQCTSDNDRCPIYFDENGEGRVSQGWELVSGVPPSLQMKLWDTTLMKFVDEVSVSWGVVRTLECSLWKNYAERMTFGTPDSNGMAKITNMQGWWLDTNSWRVVRDSGKPLDDAAWNSAHTDFRGQLTLYIGAEKNGTMTNDLNREGDGETVFTFSCGITNGTESMAFATAMVV